MRYICFVFFFASCSALLGQAEPLEQIKINILNSPNDTTKVGSYLKASQYYTFHDLNLALEYADSSFTLAKRITYRKGISYSGLNLAYLLRIKGIYAAAIEVLHETLGAIKDNSSSNASPLKIYRWLGKNHYQSRQYDSAFYWTQKTIQEAKKVKKIQDLVYAYSDYANIYYKKYDFNSAVLYYSKADSVCERHNLNSVTYLSALGRIGKMKFNTDLYTTAHKYLEKVRRRFLSLNNPAGVTEITLSLGMLEFNCDNLDRALPYLSHCLEYYTELEMTPKQMIVNRTLGQVYLEQDSLELAKKHFSEYYRLSALLNDPYEMSMAQSFLGTSYFKEKRFSNALDNYLIAKKYAHGLNDIILTFTATQGLANSYLKSAKADEAAAQYEEIVEIQDSVINLKKNERALALFAEIQAKQKEKKIDLLTSEKALAEQQKTNQRNILLGGIGLTSVALVFLFFLYRNRQKTNKKLQEIDNLKSHFFANISHEFRTPLTLISAPIEQKLQNKELNEKERADLEMIARNNKKLLHLVDQLLDLSKIEAGSLKLQLEKGNILSYTRAIADSFSYLGKNKNIDYHLNISDKDEIVWFDKDALEKILVNLLSNAFKYTADGGEVRCSAFLQQKRLKMEVSNTGDGLNSIQLERIFERFYQVDKHSEGTGIGLALVSELVSLHKGKISAKSKPGLQTVFSVDISVDKISFDPSELATSSLNQNFEYAAINESFPPDDSGILDNDVPMVLLIDDNADVRVLLEEIFSPNYNTFTATNGEEGIMLAIEKIPDLIISDLMMPIKDGIVLTNTLKKDTRTSHIPIILLTAKAGEENVLLGVETGADDYITKPFSTKILAAKVSKLIAQRRHLQNRYSQEITLKPKDIAITNLDAEFLERVQNVLDDKLTSSSFSTEVFSKTVGMSRMQLHRKLKALTGLTTSEFIRSQRLKLAVSLLEKSDVNISDIGYQVGFNDPSYFTKCFKESYGCSPSEYISK